MEIRGMAFIRTKKRTSHYPHKRWMLGPDGHKPLGAGDPDCFYYLVENYRESGRVKQRTIAYLGSYPTVETAIAGIEHEINIARKEIEESERVLAAGRINKWSRKYH